MRRMLSLLIAASAINPAASARNAAPIPVPAQRQLVGLDAVETDGVIARLTQAQRDLRAGRFQSFELLAGSIASYAAADASPRATFLRIPFDRAWNVERVRTAGDARRQYRLAYAPDGLGRRYWDIRVTLAFGGQLDRVELMYLPPAPF